MQKITKSAVTATADHSHHDVKQVEDFKVIYFRQHPEAIPYRDHILFSVRGKHISVDDSHLPKGIIASSN